MLVRLLWLLGCCGWVLHWHWYRHWLLYYLITGDRGHCYWKTQTTLALGTYSGKLALSLSKVLVPHDGEGVRVLAQALLERLFIHPLR